MRRIVEEEMAEIPGQDAFLDVLTNMVGIIILLVVVMGLRASRAAMAPPASTEFAASIEPAIGDEQIYAAQQEKIAAENAVGDLMNRVVQVRREALTRFDERNGLVNYMAAYKAELDDRRSQLTADEQRDFDLRAKLFAAQRQLDDVTQEQVGLMSKAAEVEVIENKPTPIARKSTGKMLYMQLRNGCVAVLPFKQVEQDLADDIRSNLWRLRDGKKFANAIGPYDGFRIRYYVERRTATMPAGERDEMQRSSEVITLARFEFIPVDEPLGEPVEEAMRSGSALQEALRRFPPDAGVLAIMVFPDSLPALHKLKKALYDAGYSIAEAPIPEGQWISFTTDGGYKLFAQ